MIKRKMLVAFCSIALSAGCSVRQKDGSAPNLSSQPCHADASLTNELLRRKGLDQERMVAWRAANEEGAESQRARQLWTRQAHIDADNLEWLAGQVRHHGWPRTCAVGNEGALAAFLLAQHADENLQVQRDLKVALEAAVNQHDAAKRFLAYIVDRIRVSEGKPQIYGTQWSSSGELWPVENPADLDRLRSTMELGPVEDSKPQ